MNLKSKEMMKNLNCLIKRVPTLAVTPAFGFKSSITLSNKKLSTGEASVVLAEKIKGITQQVNLNTIKTLFVELSQP